MPDRIVAGTWAFAAAMTRGDVTVRGGRAEHLEIALDKLVQRRRATSTRLPTGSASRWTGRPSAVDVVTLPYPGFPTDLQPMVLALNAVADGAAMVTENIFEARFMFVNELARLGADVRTDGHHAVVRGRERLSGAPVRGHRHPGRRRAGRSPGSCAEGVTTVSDVAPHRPRLPGLRRATCAGSAPTSPGSPTRSPDHQPAEPPGPASTLRARSPSCGNTMTRGPSCVITRLAFTRAASSRRRAAHLRRSCRARPRDQQAVLGLGAPLARPRHQGAAGCVGPAQDNARPPTTNSTSTGPTM